MKVTRHFARRFRLLKLLRASLGLGATVDAAAGIVLVAAPWIVTRALGVPRPSPGLFLHLSAVLLLVVGGLYLLAARDPRRYSGIILLAIAGRALEALVFGVHAFGKPEMGALWIAGGVSLAFAAVHALAWLPLRV